jgi:glycosyltransferase involved in cell wall biosynthesis
MRIIQIIDSLDIGGAEKMAINYANSLAQKTEFSGLVTTRKEGSLKAQITPDVNYFFLNRKSKIDFAATMRLKKFCKSNKVEFVQAHSSSFFTAFLLKLVMPSIKIIWHDHNGLSEFSNARKSFALKLTSFFYFGIIVVNYKLKNWAEKELYCKNVIYLPNFTKLQDKDKRETSLFGTEHKKILCLANLRFQKNHFLLIEVAIKLKSSHPEWSFHLVGKDFEDEYSSKVKKAISENNLGNNVFIYGSKSDTQNIISQADITILTSKSEGLPVALLEYGMNRKPVISTKVGEIPFIIKNNESGFIVENYDADGFYSRLVQIIEDDIKRATIADGLYTFVMKNHSENSVVEIFMNWLINK